MKQIKLYKKTGHYLGPVFLYNKTSKSSALFRSVNIYRERAGAEA